MCVLVCVSVSVVVCVCVCACVYSCLCYVVFVLDVELVNDTSDYATIDIAFESYKCMDPSPQEHGSFSPPHFLLPHAFEHVRAFVEHMRAFVERTHTRTNTFTRTNKHILTFGNSLCVCVYVCIYLQGQHAVSQFEAMMSAAVSASTVQIMSLSK